MSFLERKSIDDDALHKKEAAFEYIGSFYFLHLRDPHGGEKRWKKIDVESFLLLMTRL